MTSKRRNDVASTSVRRHVPAGNLAPFAPPQYSKPWPPIFLTFLRLCVYQYINIVSILSVGQHSKERICSSRNEFFPLRVDPISKNYPIQRSKQEFIQVNVTVFSEKRDRVFIRAPLFGHVYVLRGEVASFSSKSWIFLLICL